MTAEYGNLCSVILRQCFGELVQTVGDCLFTATSRSLSNLVQATKLIKTDVVNALSVLIKFQLVTFKVSDLNPWVVEYSLKSTDILYFLRLPHYVHIIQTKYGSIGAALIEEIIHEGTQTATNILVQCLKNADPKEKPEMFRDTFLTIIRDNYIMRAPALVKNAATPIAAATATPVTATITDADVIPKLHVESIELFMPPEIDLRLIMQIQSDAANAGQAKDAGIFWQINYKRFHQDFRDVVMVNAIERKLGAIAADCFKMMLKQMYERTSPWEKQTSNPFTYGELKQFVEKKSMNQELIKYLDQYVALLAEDSLGFIRKTGDMGGGQYVVHFETAFRELSLSCIENVITERFGSKASRIFRVIRDKKYIEQENLQKEAMIPSKESKLLSYNLFQEQFIHIKTIRKHGGGGTGPAKAFFLFHIQLDNVVRMLLDICYRALYNDITKTNFVKIEYKRLIEKAQKLELIVNTMKARGDSEEYIAEITETLTPPEREILNEVKSRLKTLAKAELTVDDTIFLLQMYMYHTRKYQVTVK